MHNLYTTLCYPTTQLVHLNISIQLVSTKHNDLPSAASENMQ